MNTLKEISRSIWGINSGDPVRPVQGIIFVDQGPKRYRLIVNRVKPLTKDRISCEILLIEEVGGRPECGQAPAALITGTRMGIRIRSGGYSPVCGKRPAAGAAQCQEITIRSTDMLNNIFLEAEFRGNFSPEDVVNAFDARSRTSY